MLSPLIALFISLYFGCLLLFVWLCQHAEPMPRWHED